MLSISIDRPSRAQSILWKRSNLIGISIFKSVETEHRGRGFIWTTRKAVSRKNRHPCSERDDFHPSWKRCVWSSKIDGSFQTLKNPVLWMTKHNQSQLESIPKDYPPSQSEDIPAVRLFIKEDYRLISVLAENWDPPHCSVFWLLFNSQSLQSSHWLLKK